MKCKSVCVIGCLISFILLSYSFTGNNPIINSKKDVAFKIPKGFPKPAYDFKRNAITEEGFTLGRKLFYDPILSKDSSISCAFCHQHFAAFAHIDHRLSHGINGLIGKRNVPAIQNAAWQNSFMWDGGVNHIEMQPVAPITNPSEMNEDLRNVILKLQRSKEYIAMFSKAFHDSIVTSERMLKALSQFVLLMVSSNSRFDKYERGEDTLSLRELNGLKLFRNHCKNCHKEPLFTDNSFRNIGLKPDDLLMDSGRAAVTGLVSDNMKFKVPSLRNVEVTYPYMHDGRFKTLQQVLNHYANGNFFTGNIDSSIVRNVGLTEEQKSDIITFLRTLTDETFLNDSRFDNPDYK